ncbi:LysR family transcriptional regulator [Bordetella sp. BOR01]|uniref:LysR family transcriptional regulator n=1 Tax=Bordetella sp. BOR01 TaxID=2854779 RepID=UPI001C467A27|nr:LysR substrate-binding domain-containing protein [Bordetella sp. BOR01]MBV7482615.1 LysR family transcriptional regulator [Bordetella sp. BOR01]
MLNSESIALDGRILQCFCAVAEELHFGRASARLFISQPALSQQIRRLEDLVGHPLFVRTTRSVRLTPAGEAMYVHARRITAEMEVLLHAARRAALGETGSISLGLNASATCSPVVDALHSFTQAHPLVKVELREMNSNVMELALLQGALDVGVMRPADWDTDTGTELDATVVYEENLMLAVRTDHPLNLGREITVQEIAQFPLIGYFEATSPYVRRTVQAMFAEAGVVPEFVQESLLPTVLTLVEAGVGVAIVPSSLERAFQPALSFLPIAGQSHRRLELVVATLKSQKNVAVRNLIACLVSMASAPGRR